MTLKHLKISAFFWYFFLYLSSKCILYLKPSRTRIEFSFSTLSKILGDKGALQSTYGGGFAGTIQAFVPMELLDTFHNEMEAAFGKGKCYILSIRPVGGIEIA